MNSKHAETRLHLRVLKFVLITLFFLALISCKKLRSLGPDDTQKPEVIEKSIQVDTTLRWYTVVVPTGYDGSAPVPLVLAFHPGNANMSDFYDAMKQFRDAAEEENWIVVFPNGRNRTDNRTGECLWNAVHCCGMPHGQNVDDVGFVQKLLVKLNTDYKIDPNRVDALGRSNGGMLVHRLGAEMGSIFAAIAPFNAAAGGRFREGWDPEVIDPIWPVPILMMHGLHDTNVRFEGGFSFADTLRYDISFKETVNIWTEVNSCDTTQTDTTLIETDKGRTWIVNFTSCPLSAPVIAITVENSGHKIPRESNSGFDGTQAIVDFFKANVKN